MMAKTETARLAGRAGSVVKTVSEATSYHSALALSSEISPTDYATAKVLTKFRISISTARVVAHLSGLGGDAR